MTNDTFLSLERELIAQDGAGLTHTGATSVNRGVSEERTPSRKIGRGRAQEMKRGRTGSRGGNHISVVCDELPVEIVAPGEKVRCCRPT